MRTFGFLISTALLALTYPVTPCAGATFGTAVAIAGQAADIALDQSRGLLYIANFTANRIDVMSTTTNTIQTSFHVAPQPGSIALSPDGQYLLVAHFGNTSPAVPSANQLTLIHLPDNSQQLFTTGDPPLGVAFYSTIPAQGAANFSGPGKALVVTTNGFYTLDPATGILGVVATLTDVSTTLPAAVPTFPGQLIETALVTSGDGTVIWGIGGGGTGTQIIYQFHAQTGSLTAFGWTTVPPLLPRISVAYDGSYAMVGWLLMDHQYAIQASFPAVIGSANVTGHVIDSKNGIIYAQIPDVTQPSGPPYTSGSGTAPILPTLLMMDSDNLTVKQRLLIPENLIGRIVMDSAGANLYAISDSGVTVLPVGNLNKAHRVVSDQQDLLIQTTFCNRNNVTQSLTIRDPGGNQTSFSISPTQPGVTVTPSGGTTPATVQVTIDPGQFLTEGTTAVTLNISAPSAVNVPQAVRLLVNNPDQNQRGSLVDIPGTLTDIMPDPARNRYYVVRQDVNQLQVFDGASNQMITALRTGTTPTMMTMTVDGNYLLVANDNSQYVSVFDLNALQAVTPIMLPYSHAGHSVAASNNAILVVANDMATGTGVIDSVNFPLRIATKLPALGTFKNEISPTAALTASPNGANILVADPGGTVMLYTADGDTFQGRKDQSSLSGAFAASSYNTYVIGNNFFNASLVPQGNLSATTGITSGFYFMDQGGYQVTASSATTAGVISHLPALSNAQANPISMVEAPLLPTSTHNFTRTVAPLPSSNTVLALTTSGVTVLSANYAAATTPPSIAGVLNAADGTAGVAPGGFISVYGSHMSTTNAATSQIPLPTAMGESCLTVNGTPIPLLYTSSGQINAQLPLNAVGNVTMSIHTPAGISNGFNMVVQSAAPAIFLSGVAGPQTGLATVFRAANYQLVTPTNPVYPNDILIIYLTGMGPTNPPVPSGQMTPSTLLAQVVQTPTLTLGGATLTVDYAGLVPGEVSGLYQINATVPDQLIDGLSIPLTIEQPGGSTTLNVRVVKH